MAGICGFGNLLSGSSFHRKGSSRVPLKTYASSAPNHPRPFISNEVKKNLRGQYESDYDLDIEIPCRIFSAELDEELSYRLEQAIEYTRRFNWKLRVIVDDSVLFAPDTLYRFFPSTDDIKIYARFWIFISHLQALKELGIQILIMSNEGGWNVHCTSSELTLQERSFDENHTYNQIWMNAIKGLGLESSSSQNPQVFSYPPTNGIGYDSENPEVYTSPLTLHTFGREILFIGLFRSATAPIDQPPVPLKILTSGREPTEIVAFPVKIGNIIFSNFFQNQYDKSRYDLIFDSLQKESQYTQSGNSLGDTLTLAFSTNPEALHSLGLWSKERGNPFWGVNVPVKTHLELMFDRISQAVDKETSLHMVAEKIEESIHRGNHVEEIVSEIAQHATFATILQENLKVMPLKEIAGKIASPEHQKIALEILQEIVSR